MIRWVITIPAQIRPLVTSEGLDLSESEKAQALADGLEAQFQQVKDASVQAVIELVNGAMRA
jgi:hypothetical protein